MGSCPFDARFQAEQIVLPTTPFLIYSSTAWFSWSLEILSSNARCAGGLCSHLFVLATWGGKMASDSGILSGPPLLLHREPAVVSCNNSILHRCGVASYPPSYGCPTVGESEKGSNWGISTLSLPPRHLLWLLPLLPAPLGPPPQLSQPQGQPWPGLSHLPGAPASLRQRDLVWLCLQPRRARASFSALGCFTVPPSSWPSIKLCPSIKLPQLERPLSGFSFLIGPR